MNSISKIYLNIVRLFFFTFIIHFHVFTQTIPRQLTFQNGDNIWIGTSEGLLRYQQENELWSVILPEKINDFSSDENVLWVGTDGGLFYADLRYLDWKKYSIKEGLPSDSIIRVATDQDYIYAATGKGLARMDKLVEQWQSFGDFSTIKINDIYSDKQYLWVATDSGLYYFEKQFEKWKRVTYQAESADTRVYRLFYFNDYLWTLTDKGLSKYNAAMKTWAHYLLNRDIAGSAIKYIWIDADYIWTVTTEGVIRYSSRKQTWEIFSRNTPLDTLAVNAVATTGKLSWFATSQGVYSFSEDQRRWVLYTAIEGLSDDEQETILCIGQSVICKKSDAFSVYYPSEDLWKSKKIVTTGTAGEKKKKAVFFNDEKGLGAGFPGGESISLLGRAYFKLRNKAEFTDPLWDKIGNYIIDKNLDSAEYAKYKDYLYWWTKAQLNLNADFKNNRTLRCTYDNTDPLGTIGYGVEYRGYGDDILKKAGWLYDQTTDYFNSTLIDPTYIEGASVRAEFGDRVGEKKRRQVNTGAWAGWRKTEYCKKLIQFQEDNFYSLNVNNIITESVELRVDGKIIDPREYSIERTRGVLTFKNESLVNPDSRIEVALEYEPEIGGHTNEMAALENVVVLSDALSVGANGLYRRFKEPDRPGTGTAQNQLAAGSVNSKIELKSNDGKVLFKAVPEVSSSYNDSIVATKHGTAGKITINSSIHNLRMKGQAQLLSTYYETLADISSVYGRINNQEEFEATWDILPWMPVTAGVSLVDAASGRENKEYFEYLLSPSGLPSFKIQGFHQGMYCQKKRKPIVQVDSATTERWNGRVEAEWDVSGKALDILHLKRLWLNGSYTINSIDDSLFDSTGSGLMSVLSLNHNLFGWLRISPVSNLTLEVKPIYRLFQQKNQINNTWNKKGSRFKPEFTLFSQELIPGITLYGKYIFEKSNTFFHLGETTFDSSGIKTGHRLNSNILLIPGVWWRAFNAFQMNAGYNFIQNDSSSGLNDNSVKTSLSRDFGQTLTLYPTLDFGQDVHLASRTELSNQKRMDSITAEAVKVFNDVELYFRERKTKLLFEYDLYNLTDYIRTYSDNMDSLTVASFKHDFRLKWTERWKPLFRTELPITLGWQRADSTFAYIADSSKTGTWKNSISPGLLIDWRLQKKVLREFRVQYFIGMTFYDAPFLKFDEYKSSWDNKLDISIKAGRNLFLRMLVNVNYLFNERLLKYDMAELKATALF